MEYSINCKWLQNLSNNVDYAINKVAIEIVSEVVSMAESGNICQQYSKTDWYKPIILEYKDILIKVLRSKLGDTRVYFVNDILIVDWS